MSRLPGSSRWLFTGSGTVDDPHLDGHATVSGLTVGGEALGGLNFTAQTKGNALHYEARTLLVGAEMDLQGQTALHDDYATDNRLEFSHFDMGALLKLAHIGAQRRIRAGRNRYALRDR